MKKFFACLVAVVTMGIAASAANYTINEDAIDEMIENAVAVSPLEAMPEAPAASVKLGSSTDPLVAVLLNAFLGYLGIHRLYLGTSVLTVVLYIITFGGFGVVDLIDFIFLLLGFVDGNISAYVNNDSLFMWLN